MTAHEYHPRTDDPAEPLLFDGCPRCAETAASPFRTLDDDRLLALVTRTRAWMRDEPGSNPRSDAEQVAQRTMEMHLTRQGRLDRLEVRA